MDNAESISSNNQAPDQDVPMIDGIPEEYFRAFIGKNADYYIQRFRKFEKITKNNEKRSLNYISLIGINYSAFVINILLNLVGFFYYRKMLLYALPVLLIEIFLFYANYLIDAVYIQIIYAVIVISASMVANFLYYLHCKKNITRIAKMINDNKILCVLASRGGTSISSALLYFIVMRIIFLIVIFPLLLKYLASMFPDLFRYCP